MAKKIITVVETKPKYPKIIDRRLQQLRFQLEEQKAEFICVSFLPNIRYLTNFSGSSALIFVSFDEIHFITDDRYEEQIKDELYPLPNLITHITRDPWNYLVEKNLLNDVQSIAFEADCMPYAVAVEIRNIIRPVKFKPAANLVSRFTQPKDPDELKYIRKSLELTEQVYQYMLEFIKPGMTEIEIAIELSYQCRKAGSEGEPTEIVVVSGNRGSLVFGNPSDRKVRNNELISLDFGCRVNGFGSDISRTVALGRVTKEQKLMYDVLRTAQRAAIKEVRPGMNGKHLDSIARNIIFKEGFGDYFKHTVGHGMGLQAVESPIISNYLEDQIVPEDTVIGIEPGIYVPDKFGMRVEEVMLVTPNGGEVLLAAPDEIAVIL
jgi:Xaa-Pro aminopeptidase